jgi:hypothetical protein
MMFRVAIAVIALAVPAFAQHGGGHAGSSGSRGFSGNAGFSSHPAFSQPSFSRPAFSQSPNFARPAQPAHYGSYYRPMHGAGFRTIGPQSYLGRRNYSGLRTPYNGTRFVAGRPSQARSPYDPTTAGVSRSGNGDRNRFDAGRRQFQSWAVNTYPYRSGYGYPYLIDPNAFNLGLYDWSDSDNSAPGSYESDSSQPGSPESDQGPGSYASDQNGSVPPYLAPYPNQGHAPPVTQAGAAAPDVPTPAVSDRALTVIFKTSRAPIEVQNYLLTAKVLTDLDSQHYEQIPLDQVDLAATRRFNSFAGVDFQVPAASRD